jgi:hypothetical protein
MSNIVNRGTGAGGANTNKTGLGFECYVSNENVLLEKGFEIVKYGKRDNMYYLEKEYVDLNKKVYYAKKKAFKHLTEQLLGIESFKEPDEAYLIHSLNDDTYQLKIVEVKNQNRDGSVEEKLVAGGGFKAMYNEHFKGRVNVHYAYTVSDFLKRKLLSDKPRYKLLMNLFARDDINILFGCDENYSQELNKWLEIP